MVTIDIDFERALSDAFHGGETLCRELRLTEEEAQYIRTAWPFARLEPMSGSGESKAWYEMRVGAEPSYQV